MKGSIERIFTQDVDVRRYAAADTASGEYVAEQTEVGHADCQKHDLPPGLSARDADILRLVKRRANVLDKHFNLCGAQFGWSFIVAIIPVVGDAFNPVLGYFLIVHQARKAKLPGALTRRMIFNLTISATIGMVPIIGDVLIASYRANVRNAKLLENFLLLRGERAAKAATTSEKEDKNTGADDDDEKDEKDKPREAGQDAENNALAIPQMPLMSPSSQPGAEGSSSDGEMKWRTTPAPESAVRLGDDGVRDSRHTLEFVQHRDSRFIEDVS